MGTPEIRVLVGGVLQEMTRKRDNNAKIFINRGIHNAGLAVRKYTH